MRFFNFLFLVVGLLACTSGSDSGQVSDNNNEIKTSEQDTIPKEEPLYYNVEVSVGAERLDEYLTLLEGQRVGIVGNQSSMVDNSHLVDTLIASGIEVLKVFSPEHGFRGKAGAGEKVNDEIDEKTGLPIISLYGKNRKPSKEQLSGLDILVFDIQDVGARFYTYISTLHYVMEAAAENNIKVLVLDRPNPNGHYVDGPVLDPDFSSFVGMHEVPVVHGMTIGEYAQMINGEGWLGDNLTCDLQVVACKGWDHTKFYELPIAPSPNLPNMMSVYLYPSLCFFEGTVVSIGRGTDYPFQVVGHPDFEVDVLEDLYSFTPAPNDGASKPKLQGETCYGYKFYDQDIRSTREKAKLDLSYLLEFYHKLKMGKEFFLNTDFINLLAGSDQLKMQIIEGKSMEEIRDSWQEDLEAFKQVRKKYLLYPNF